MASLPEHWESDYDGSRWFFRYKPTGIIQYTFPKPGDEFPEYIDATAPPLDLPPEEKLVSQKQVKRRSTTDGQPVKPLESREKDEVVSATLAKGEGVGFWFQPDYMYLGPGSYDISPVNEYDEEEELALARGKSEKNKALDQASVTASPMPSAEGTPLGQTTQLAAPLENVAELPTESTAQCLHELHPPPVELPDHGVMVESTDPMAYSNAFDIAPAELPTESQSMEYYRSAPQTDSSTVSSRPEDWYRSQSQGTNAVAGQREQPHSQLSSTDSHIGGVGKPTTQYRPYNPTRVASEGHFNRYSVANSYSPNIGQTGVEFSAEKKPDPPGGGPSAVPSVLRPPQPPPKRPLDNVDMARQFGNPAYWAQRQSISGPVTRQQGSDLAGRVPSVLQPARGRPVLPLDSSQPNRRVSPPKAYQAYKPYQPLQQSVNNAASKSSTEHQQPYRPSSAAPALQHPASQQSSLTETRPAVARTNTLPTHMPSLPFMGIGPQTVASDPPVPIISELAKGTTHGGKPASEKPTQIAGQVDLSAYINCSNPELSAPPDFPAPLRVVHAVPEMDVTTSVAPKPRGSEQAPMTSSRERSKAALSSTMTDPAQGDSASQEVREAGSTVNTTVAAQPLVSDGSSVANQQTSCVTQLRSPVERPATSFSVVSDFSIVSEPLPPNTSVSRETSYSSRQSSAPSTTDVLSASVHSGAGDRGPSSSPVASRDRVGASAPGTSEFQPKSLEPETARAPVASTHRASVSSYTEIGPQNANSRTPPRHPAGQPSSMRGNSPHSNTSSPSSHRALDPRTPPHPHRQSQGSAHSVTNQSQVRPMPSNQTNISQTTSPAQSRPHSVAYGQISPPQASEPQRVQYERRMSEVHGQQITGSMTATQAPTAVAPPRPPKEALVSHHAQASTQPTGTNAPHQTPQGQEGRTQGQPATQQKNPAVHGSAPAVPHTRAQGGPTNPQAALQHPPFMVAQGQGNMPVMLVRDPRFPHMMAYQWQPQPAQQGAMQPALPFRPGTQNQQKQQISPVKEKTGWFGGLMKGGNGKKTEETKNTSPVDDSTRRNRLQKSSTSTTAQPAQGGPQHLPHHPPPTTLASVPPQPSVSAGYPHLQFPLGTHPPQAQQMPGGQSFAQRISGQHQHPQSGKQSSAPQQGPVVYQQTQVPSAYTHVQGIQAAERRPMPAGGQAILSNQGRHPQPPGQMHQQQGNAAFGAQPSQPSVPATGQAGFGHHPQPQPIQQAARPQSFVNSGQVQHQAQRQQPSQQPGAQNVGMAQAHIQVQQFGTAQAKAETKGADTSGANKASTKTSNAWGNPSGYDGSGWGDDDDGY